MTDAEQVVVVVPAHNELEHLPRCVRALTTAALVPSLNLSGTTMPRVVNERIRCPPVLRPLVILILQHSSGNARMSVSKHKSSDVARTVHHSIARFHAQPIGFSPSGLR